MNELLSRADEVTRRGFLSGAAKSFLGVGLSAGLLGRVGGAVTTPEEAAALYKSLVPRKNPAKKVIYLYMSGGMSHLDTLNPRPDAAVEYRGEVEAIGTSADGVRISEYLPGLAKHMHHAVLFNSLHSTQGAHQQGNYLMHTNYVKRGTIQHPHLGAWHLKLAGRMNEQLPGFIRVGGGSRDQGAGFFDTTFEPLSIRDPKSGLKYASHYKDVGDEEFGRRVELSKKLGYDFRNRYDDKGVKAYTSMYDEAVRLMRSEDLAAFDLSQETAATREAYGDDSFGQGCLLARRLAENGVRFVEVQLGGWDTHTDNFVRVPERTAILDRGLSALLGDLESRGQLGETMVVLATEFGRTPKINGNVGRDHFPKCFSAMIAGGGINGGQVHGTSNVEGTAPEENPMGIPDFNATVAYGLGMDLGLTLYSPSRRPFTVGNKGVPVTGLFRS